MNEILVETFFLQSAVEGEGPHAEEISREEFIAVLSMYPLMPIEVDEERRAIFLRDDLMGKEQG